MSEPLATFHRLLNGQLEEIPQLAAEMSQWAQAVYVPARAIVRMNLMLDELITNTIVHGYAQAGGPIEVDATWDHRDWTVTLTDYAFAHDPLQAAEPDTTLDLDGREVGGLGVFFLRKLADQVSYQRVEQDGRAANRLCIVKHLPAEGVGLSA